MKELSFRLVRSDFGSFVIRPANGIETHFITPDANGIALSELLDSLKIKDIVFLVIKRNKQ
jgi:hypothetical protein